jgi:hypothetical protein
MHVAPASLPTCRVVAVERRASFLFVVLRTGPHGRPAPVPPAEVATLRRPISSLVLRISDFLPSMSAFPWRLLSGALLVACGMALCAPVATAQSAASRPARSAPLPPSPSARLPDWAEPRASPRPPARTPPPSDAPPPGRMTTKGNPGFPGPPEQEVPLGGGGTAVLLAMAGAGYGIRRLYRQNDPHSPSPSG